MTKKSILPLLEALGKLSNFGIFLVNLRAQKLEYVNESLLKYFDISHASFGQEISFYINHIISEDLDHLRLALNTLLEDDRVEKVEFRVKSHDQQTRYLSSNCYLLEKKYVVGLVSDISDEKEHEDYIINYGAKKNTLLDMVTHNLSAPLAVSRNIIESLSASVSTGHLETIKEHVNLIRENTAQCIDLVNDFLTEEHMVSKDIYTKNNRFHVIEKITSILERFEKSYPDYRFKLITEGSDFFITNDDVKFLQIINNLLSNAVKFSTPNSQIQVAVKESQDRVVVEVIDEGIGIPGHLKSMLFEKHTPAGRPGVNGEKSVGMGLYVVKKLVALMHGDIKVWSQENKGSVFTLDLPRENQTSH